MMWLTRRRLLSLAAVPAASAFASSTWAAPQQIMEERFVPIGGIQQWLAIRGRDRTRIPLLFLHGGPCEAQSPFLSLFAPWEKRYVVAQWDQRGTGRTFGKNGLATPNMTLQQLAQDAVELTQYVLERLQARKLVLVGHSWGAALGLSVIRLRPELFHALVGTGQPVSGAETLAIMRSAAAARAQAAGDLQAAAKLQRLSVSDFTQTTELSPFFKWVAPFPKTDLDFLIKRDAMLGSPGKPASVAASDFYTSNPNPGDPAAHPVCLQKLLPYSLQFDAGAAGYELPVPYFVIQGRDDPRTPAQSAREFVNRVRAPVKGYTAIAGGHFACFANPTGFLNALDSDLRRLGISSAPT